MSGFARSLPARPGLLFAMTTAKMMRPILAWWSSDVRIRHEDSRAVRKASRLNGQFVAINLPTQLLEKLGQSYLKSAPDLQIPAGSYRRRGNPEYPVCLMGIHLVT